MFLQKLQIDSLKSCFASFGAVGHVVGCQQAWYGVSHNDDTACAICDQAGDKGHVCWAGRVPSFFQSMETWEDRWAFAWQAAAREIVGLDSVDEIFGRFHAERVATYWTPADAHIHVGGTVRWSQIWNWLMTGRYPPTFFLQTPMRRFCPRFAARLLSRAVQARATLFDHAYIPKLTLSLEYPFDDVLAHVNAIMIDRKTPVNIRRAVLDYVCIRSLFEAEARFESVADLTEYTLGQWTRFWGKKTKLKALALMRRQANLDADKCEVAFTNTVSHGVKKASFRLNVDHSHSWRSYHEIQRLLKRIRKANSARCDFGLVIHGRRPKPNGEKLPTTDPAEDRKKDPSVAQWKRTREVLEHWKTAGMFGNIPIGLDLAGPEKDCPAKVFRQLVKDTADCAAEQRWGLTIHAGEDFLTPMQGILHILIVVKECIDSGLPPRIGHGSVLGLNTYPPESVLGRARRFDQMKKLSEKEVDQYREILRELENMLRELENNEYAERVKQISCRMQEAKAWNCNDRAIQGLIAELVDFVWERLPEGTCIETNPTSNLSVLGVEDAFWLPTWGLLLKAAKKNKESERNDKENSNERKVTILLGSDNPGLHNSSVIGEAWLLHDAAQESLILLKMVREMLKKTEELAVVQHRLIPQL